MTGGTNTSNTIPFVASTSYVTSGTAGNWSADIANGSGSATIAAFGDTATIIAQKASATANADFTVTYKAYVGTETPADTYTGTMTYALSTL